MERFVRCTGSWIRIWDAAERQAAAAETPETPGWGGALVSSFTTGADGAGGAAGGGGGGQRVLLDPCHIPPPVAALCRARLLAELRQRYDAGAMQQTVPLIGPAAELLLLASSSADKGSSSSAAGGGGHGRRGATAQEKTAYGAVRCVAKLAAVKLQEPVAGQQEAEAEEWVTRARGQAQEVLESFS